MLLSWCRGITGLLFGAFEADCAARNYFLATFATIFGLALLKAIFADEMLLVGTF